MRSWIAGLLTSLRLSLRGFLRQPAFAATAVAALGLGIGASTALFSVADAVLMRPLPYHEPERLVSLERRRADGSLGGNHSLPDLVDVRARNRVFDGVVAVADADTALLGRGPAASVAGARVTAGFLRLLGRTPTLGRDFGPEDFAAGAAKVALLSDELWHGRFGGDPAILGQTVSLGGVTHTVIGVLPPRLVFDGYLQSAEIVVPMEDGSIDGRASRFLEAYARLRPGVDLAAADADLEAIFRRLAEEYPQSNTGTSVAAVPLHDGLVGEAARTISILAAAVAMVLFIACANVASMLLARGATREREAAVRAALGASRGDLVTVFLADAVALSLAGGLLGAAIAGWGVDLLLAAAPEGLPLLQGVGLDARALGVALLLSLASGLLAGLVPAFLAARRDPREALAEGGRGGVGRGHRVRSALVVAEIAASLVLLVAASLLVRSFRHLLAVDPGFAPHGAAVFEVDLPTSRYPEKGDVKRATERIAAAVAELPGVSAAGGTLTLPYSGTSINIDLWPVGKPLPILNEAPTASCHVITEGYFRAMGMTLLEGRELDAHDDGTRRAIVVNRSFADRYWPGQRAIGQRVMVNLSEETTEQDAYEVVGVVRDVRQFGLDQPPAAEMYLPQREFGVRFQYFVVRAEGDPTQLEEPVRRAVEAIDPELPVSLRPLSDYVGASLVERRFVMLLLTLLSGLALALAAIGIYGVMAYAVSLRRRELSIRMAVGAHARQILLGVLRQAFGLSAIGIALGVAGALAVSRFLASFLFGVTATDPATYVVLAGVLTAISLLAGLGPARRAAQVDPMTVLREE